MMAGPQRARRDRRAATRTHRRLRADLFHRNGIRGVGVEAIVEAAHTNKMTLYRHFDSKDDLILEYLNYKGRKTDEIWARIEATWPGDPVNQLYGLIRQGAEIDRRGRARLRSRQCRGRTDRTGHPGLKVIEEFKVQHRDRLAKLCKAAGASQPDLLADSLVLLVEGARVSRRSVGAEGPSANLVRTADAVIASFGVPARDKSDAQPKAPDRRSLRGAEARKRAPKKVVEIARKRRP